MKLEYIKIENFRQIKSKKYDFKEDINIIFGPNESGKTTLFHAIISALFDNPQKIRKTLLESYKPWKKDIYPILEFGIKVDGVDYTIIKDFNSKKVLLNGKNDSNIDQFILNSLGIDKDLFLKLSCIYQNQLSSIEENSKSLEVSILDILSNSSSQGMNVLDAISKVSKKIRDLQLGIDRPSKSIGIIKKLDIEIKELEEKLQKSKDDFNSFSLKNKELDKKQKELNEAEKKYRENEIFINNSRKATELSNSIKNINNEMEDLQSKISRINKIKGDLDNLNKNFKKEEFDKFNDFQEEILDLRGNIEIRKKDLDKIQKQKEEVDKLEIRPIRKNSPIIFIVSFVLVVITIIASFFSYYILGALFIDVVFVGLYLRFVDYHKLENFKNPADESLSQISSDIKSFESRLSSILSGLKCNNVDEFFKKKAELLLYNEEKIKLESTLKGILGKENIDDLEKKITGLAVKKREIDLELNQDLKDFINVDATLINKKRIENEDLDLDIFTLGDDIAALNVRLKDNTFNKDDIEELEEELKSKKSEIRFYRQRVKTLEIVEENLNQAKNFVVKNLSSDLTKFGDEWISNITNNRYTKINIVNKSRFEVYSKELNAFIPLSDNLSTGLIDQVYLLARLSMLNTVMQGKSSIMIFDDPFVNFDSERLKKTEDMLKYFSKFNQVFLFTCHDFFSKSKLGG